MKDWYFKNLHATNLLCFIHNRLASGAALGISATIGWLLAAASYAWLIIGKPKKEIKEEDAGEDENSA